MIRSNLTSVEAVGYLAENPSGRSKNGRFGEAVPYS